MKKKTKNSVHVLVVAIVAVVVSTALVVVLSLKAAAVQFISYGVASMLRMIAVQ